MQTRREILKTGASLAAILASGKAPAAFVRSMLGARNAMGRKAGVVLVNYVDTNAATGSSYDNGAVIDTGYVCNMATKISMRGKFLSTKIQWGCFLGGGSSDGANDEVEISHNSGESGRAGSLFFDRSIPSNGWMYADLLAAHDYEITPQYFKLDSTTKSRGYLYVSKGTWPIKIGCRNLAGRNWRCENARFWWVRIHQSGELVREYLPAYDKRTAKFGFLETVSATFKPSITGVEFSGPVASATNGGGISANA